VRKTPTSSPDPELDTKVIEALMEAHRLPPGKERTEALKKAGRLPSTADTYKHIFSKELKPPE
jgi:hypothetical protein